MEIAFPLVSNFLFVALQNSSAALGAGSRAILTRKRERRRGTKFNLLGSGETASELAHRWLETSCESPDGKRKHVGEASARDGKRRSK